MIHAVLMLLILLMSGGPVTADEPAAERPSGEEIMRRSRDLIYKIHDQKNTVTLRLIDKGGAERKIVANRFWKNYNEEGDFDSKTILFTEFPPDARGTAFLIWDYSTQDKPDDLWIYLPALKTTRRVGARDQNDAFMGSDLTFADMGQRRLDEDTHTFVHEEVFSGEPAYVVESVPKEKDSIYSKKISWISKKDLTVLKIDYYDRNDRPLKRQVIEWQTLGGVFVWRRSEIRNEQTSHRTVLEVSDLKVNIGLSDSNFTERVLKTGLKR